MCCVSVPLLFVQRLVFDAVKAFTDLVCPELQSYLVDNQLQDGGWN